MAKAEKFSSKEHLKKTKKAYLLQCEVNFLILQTQISPII